MKRCNKCGRELPLSDFYAMKGMRDGHRNDCKACNLAAKAARYRANPEPMKRRVREWQRANAETVSRRLREYRASERGRRAGRDGHLRRKFGITIDDYERMLGEQGGGCAICGRPPRPDISLHVDHCHEMGTVRGLVCFSCNNALGDFSDDPDLLLKAADYLMREEVDETRSLALARVKALPAPRWAA